MNATTTNRAKMAFAPVTAPATATDSIRFAQNSILTELPGVAFGLVTLAYLVGSLLALA
jgi:hypothetical protein